MTTELTDDNFEDAIKSGLVVVDFWAEWCGPCKMVGPIIEQLAEEFKGKAIIAKVDVDKNQETAAKFQISSIPTVMIFKDGIEVDRKTGAAAKMEFAAMVEKHLK